MLAAPASLAAAQAAPCGMPPWVTVGPSSTAITRLPRTAAASSSVTGEPPRTSRARALAARTLSAMRATPAGAASALATSTMSAMRSTASPG